jgi:predicted flap endonuclease-1-like 5' DNA nuclease
MQKLLLLTLCGLALAGCDQLGLENPAQIAAAREAEGRAVGGACRHSGRALEDCYKLNPKAQKSAVFGGWRDMDAYMRENSIEIVPSSIQRDEAAKKKAAAEEVPADKTTKPAEAPVKKGSAGHTATERPQPLPAGGGKMV